MLWFANYVVMTKFWQAYSEMTRKILSYFNNDSLICVIFHEKSCKLDDLEKNYYFYKKKFFSWFVFSFL